MKTAVEWLVEELEDNSINLDLAFELIEQAKEMDKEQKIKSKIEAVNHFCKLNGFADTNMHKSVISMYEKQLKK
jgi:hypothetical protein